MLKEAWKGPPLELFSTGLPTPWFCISGLQTDQGIVSLKTQTWLWLPVLNTSNSTDVCCWSWPSQGSRSFLQCQTQAHWASSNLRLPLGALFLLFSYQVVSDSLQLHGLQHARLPCPSPSPRVFPNSCPLNRCCHPAISSSVALFSSFPQSFPTSGSFPMSRLFTSCGQSIGALASASVLPTSIQGWFPLRLTGLIYLLSKGLWRAFFSTAIWKHQFFSALPSLWSRWTGKVASPSAAAAAAAAKSLQSCPTLCDPIGILQARTLEWVAISFSSAWKWKVKVTSLSPIRLFVTPWTAAYQAPLPMGFSRQEYWSRVPLPSPPKS